MPPVSVQSKVIWIEYEDPQTAQQEHACNSPFRSHIGMEIPHQRHRSHNNEQIEHENQSSLNQIYRSDFITVPRDSFVPRKANWRACEQDGEKDRDVESEAEKSERVKSIFKPGGVGGENSLVEKQDGQLSQHHTN